MKDDKDWLRLRTDKGHLEARGYGALVVVALGLVVLLLLGGRLFGGFF